VVGHPLDGPLVAFPARLEPLERGLELGFSERFLVGVAREGAAEHEAIAPLPTLENRDTGVMSDGVIQRELTSGAIGVDQAVVADDIFPFRHVGDRFAEREDAVMEDHTQLFVSAGSDVWTERFKFFKHWSDGGRDPVLVYLTTRDGGVRLLLQSDDECLGREAAARAKRMFWMDELVGGHCVCGKPRPFPQVSNEGLEAVELAGRWTIFFKVSDQADTNAVQVERVDGEVAALNLFFPTTADVDSSIFNSVSISTSAN